MNRSIIIRTLTVALSAIAITSWAEELTIGHFGRDDYGDWTAQGTAFRKGPAAGDLLNKLEIENAGEYAVASSEIEGDGPTGTLTSPPFQIAKRTIAFRIGG